MGSGDLEFTVDLGVERTYGIVSVDIFGLKLMKLLQNACNNYNGILMLVDKQRGRVGSR